MQGRSESSADMKDFYRQTLHIGENRRVEVAISSRSSGPMNPCLVEEYPLYVSGPRKVGNSERMVNRAKFMQDALKLNDNEVCIPKLEHGGVVKYTSQHNAYFTQLTCDGLLTEAVGLGLAVFAADCVPVVLAAPIGERDAVLSVLHVGWRGFEANIIENALTMMRRFGARMNETVVWTGPCIQKCCFEVGPDVASRLVPGKGFVGHAHLSLPDLIGDKFAFWGVLDVQHAVECTKCFTDEKGKPVFFSRRRDGLVDPSENHMCVAVIR